MSKAKELESQIVRALQAGDQEFALKLKKELDRAEAPGSKPIAGQYTIDGGVIESPPTDKPAKLF